MNNFSMHGIDLFIIFAYLLAIPIFGFYFKKFVKSGEDFFLAGRMLPWWIIGFSIIGSNIGATDYVGGAGGAYRFGLTQANFEWIGALPAIALSALLFVPYYWRSGAYTVPEFLGRRYNATTRFLQIICWGSFLIFLMGQYFWASSLMLEEYIGIPGAVGLIITAAIVGVYTVAGGMGAVAINDVIQVLVMFVGGLAITVLGLWTVGGWDGLIDKIIPAHPDHLSLFLPPDHPIYPWPAVILGLAFVASPAWWCCNQAMIQRTLGAKSEWDAKAGMMFAGLPKMLIPLLTVLPGLIALALNPSLAGADMDKAYPWLIKNLLPAGLAGLVFSSFMAALISSVDSVLNSAATMWTRDIYQAHIVTRASDKHYLLVGRVMTAAFIILAIIIAPIMKRFPGLFTAGQYFLALFQGPTFAITLLGIYWRRANQWGGLAGLIGGMVISALLYMKYDVSFFYISWWSFFGAFIITVVVSLVTEPDPLEKLDGLVYRLVMKDDIIQSALKKRVQGGNQSC
ncbi:MAG: sodium:solute symporter family transporter [Candidatus Zhuqueibacterota bacterium]